MDQQEIKTNLKDVNQWARILYMVLFSICLYVAVPILFLVATVQAVFAIVTAQPNANLRQLGSSLSQYIHQLASFLTYSTEDKAFPFADWPEAKIHETSTTDIPPASEDNEGPQEKPTEA